MNTHEGGSGAADDGGHAGDAPDTLAGFDPIAAAARIRGIGASRKAKGVSVGLMYLAQHRQKLTDLESVYDFVDARLDDEEGELKPVEHWLTQVRAHMARELWSQHLYVGVSVIDELLYDAVRGGAPDPIEAVLRQLVSSPLLRHPGFVIYPLHSFGVLGAGLRRDFDVSRFEALARRFGVVFSPQTNSVEATVGFLESAAEYFGVPGWVDEDLIQDWHRSRASWLERNPLIAVRVHELSGDYYENQRLVLDRVTIAVVLMLAMSLLQPDRPEGDLGALFSTGGGSNFQTLDIHHYCVLSPSRDGDEPTTGRKVPMSLDATYLAELSALPVDVDAVHWADRTDDLDELWTALETLQTLQLHRRLKREKASATEKMGAKVFDALTYFRRSFHRDGGAHWAAVVSLATAFEMLLTDSYQRGVTERLETRVRLLLDGHPDAEADARLVSDLYASRSKIVHRGDHLSGDLRPAQRLFLRCLTAVTTLMPGLQPNEPKPADALFRTSTSSQGLGPRAEPDRGFTHRTAH